MSKKRRFPRKSATNPKQVKAEGRIHELRKVNVTLVGDDGYRETVQLTERQLMKIMENRSTMAATVNAKSESGKDMTLTVGGSGAGKMYGEGGES